MLQRKFLCLKMLVENLSDAMFACGMRHNKLYKGVLQNEKGFYRQTGFFDERG
jgi:hypothetical protein